MLVNKDDRVYVEMEVFTSPADDYVVFDRSTAMSI